MLWMALELMVLLHVPAAVNLGEVALHQFHHVARDHQANTTFLGPLLAVITAFKTPWGARSILSPVSNLAVEIQPQPSVKSALKVTSVLPAPW